MNLKTVESAVKTSLINDVNSRKSDFKLYVETLKELGFNVGCLENFFDTYSYSLPSFEAVTRARRLVQAQMPELKDVHVSKYRKKIKEPEFKEYSKTKIN
jgi:hypothetical protein